MPSAATFSPPLPSLLPEHWLSGPREQEGEEEVKEEGRFLVLHLRELPRKDWWGGVWKYVSPRYIHWPPLMTLGKRGFWVFFLDFLSQLETPRLSGEGFRRHQENLQQFLHDSREQL